MFWRARPVRSFFLKSKLMEMLLTSENFEDSLRLRVYNSLFTIFIYILTPYFQCALLQCRYTLLVTAVLAMQIHPACYFSTVKWLLPDSQPEDPIQSDALQCSQQCNHVSLLCLLCALCSIIGPNRDRSTSSIFRIFSISCVFFIFCTFWYLLKCRKYEKCRKLTLKSWVYWFVPFTYFAYFAYFAYFPCIV